MSKKGNETRKKICKAAHRLFSEKGFKSVTMKDICEATGLSRGGLYRHYSGTAQILDELLTGDYTLEENIQNGETATEILEDYLNRLKYEMLDTEASLSLAIYEYANMGNEKKFIDGTNIAVERWNKLIEYGISTGEFNNVNPSQITDVILYSYQGVRMWSRVIPLGKETANHIIDTIKLLLLKENSS